MSNRIAIAFSFTAFLLILGFGACIYELLWRARHFLEDALTLEVGRSSFDDAQRLAKRYHAVIIQIGDMPPTCSSDSCNYLFDLRSVCLHRFALAPPSSFGGIIRVREGKVISRELAMGTGMQNRYLEVFAEEKENMPMDKPMRLVQYLKMPRLGIEFSPSAPIELRRIAGEFDLKCLTRIGGCKDHQEMLPALRKLEQLGYALEAQR